MANLYVPSESLSAAQADRHFFPRMADVHIPGVRNPDVGPAAHNINVALTSQIRPWDGLKEVEQTMDMLARVQAQRAVAERRAVGLEHANNTKVALEQLYMDYEQKKGSNALEAKADYDKGVQKILEQGMKEAPDPWSRHFYAQYTREYAGTYGIRGQGHYNKEQEATIISAHEAAIGLAQNDMFGAKNNAELTLATGNLTKAYNDYFDHVGLQGDARDFKMLQGFSGVYKKLIGLALDKENVSGARGLLAQFGGRMLEEDKQEAMGQIADKAERLAIRHAARAAANKASNSGDIGMGKGKISQALEDQMFQAAQAKAIKDLQDHIQPGDDLNAPGPLNDLFVSYTQKYLKESKDEYMRHFNAAAQLEFSVRDGYVAWRSKVTLPIDANPVAAYAKYLEDTGNTGGLNNLKMLRENIGDDDKFLKKFDSFQDMSASDLEQLDTIISQSEVDPQKFLADYQQGLINLKLNPTGHKRLNEAVIKAQAAVNKPTAQETSAWNAQVRARLPDNAQTALGTKPEKLDEVDSIVAGLGSRLEADYFARLAQKHIDVKSGWKATDVALEEIASTPEFQARTKQIKNLKLHKEQLKNLQNEIAARFDGSKDAARSIVLDLCVERGILYPTQQEIQETVVRLVREKRVPTIVEDVLLRETNAELEKQRARRSQQEAANKYNRQTQTQRDAANPKFGTESF